MIEDVNNIELKNFQRSSGRVNKPNLSNNLPKEFIFTQNKHHDGKKDSIEKEKEFKDKDNSDTIKNSDKSDSLRNSDKSDSLRDKLDKSEKSDNKPPMPHKRAIKTLNPYNQPAHPIPLTSEEEKEKERERKDMSNLVTPINVMKLKKDERKSKLQEQKRSRSGSINHVQVKHIQLTELITFNVIGTGSSGTTKKMLHAPTLHFYALKEIPLWTREVRQRLLDQLNLLTDSSEFQNDHLVRVKATFWNTPEGCVSLLTQQMDGSLQDVLSNIGILNEYTLKQITKSSLKALDFMHSKLAICHGYIRPHQILYDKSGKVKLSLGISSKLSPEQKNSAIGMKQNKQGSLFDSEIADELFLMYEQEMTHLLPSADEQASQDKAIDVYELGLSLLMAVVGDNALIYENFQDFQADQQESTRNNYEFCFNSLIDWLDSREQEMIDDRNLALNKITLRKILQCNRITENLRLFLIECLRFDWRERASAETLLSHAWLADTNKQNPNECLVSTSEMIRAEGNLNKTESSQVSEQQLDRLVEALELVLPSCSYIPPKDLFDDYSKNSRFKRLIGELEESYGLKADDAVLRIKNIFNKFQNNN